MSAKMSSQMMFWSSNKFKMIRIHTQRIVACVINLQFVRNQPFR